MKKLTNKQLKALQISPKQLAWEIHKLCPKTVSGLHKFLKRRKFSGGYQKEKQCNYCGMYEV